MGENRLSHWFDDGLANTEFLAARYSDFAFNPHFHETYAIGIIEAGGQFFRPKRRDPLIMPAGKLCVINPGTVHEGRSATEDGWIYRMFYPSSRLVARALSGRKISNAEGFWCFASHVIDDHILYRSFAALHTASRNGESLLERESRTYWFLCELFQRHADCIAMEAPSTTEPKAVATIQAYLHSHWDMDVSISDLAQETGLSETHTIRAFSQSMGMPPHAYLQALRVERAKALIRSGIPLAEAADAAAFYDQSQMNRHFKKVVGLTPGAYARRARDRTGMSGITKTPR